MNDRVDEPLVGLRAAQAHEAAGASPRATPGRARQIPRWSGRTPGAPGRSRQGTLQDVPSRHAPTPPDSAPDVLSPAALASTARACRGFDLLILFGSRARGDARPGADWDCGYLADETTDVPALVEALGDDRNDLVDLRTAGGLLRYRAARDGRPAHEASAGLFDPLSAGGDPVRKVRSGSSMERTVSPDDAAWACSKAPFERT